MRISDLAFAVMVVLLAGCAELSGRPPADAVALPDGLIVKGAAGWCVESASRSRKGEANVVVLASCAALGGEERAPAVPGVITIAVDPAIGTAPDADLLEAYFATEAGRASLALDGRAGSVNVLEMRRDGDRLYLYAEDKSDIRPDAIAQDYWRALFGIQGHFVSVSFVGSSSRPVARSDGLRTVAAQADALEAVNP